jgi:hypothetical protein
MRRLGQLIKFDMLAARMLNHGDREVESVMRYNGQITPRKVEIRLRFD